ncbi:hypothetical protein [Otariodibacter sp.]|uniref:hypothetical protein n=1 Tax=Otariodibacter sp. TaxID=3030919 RepID=UPI00262A30DA|nr:hypothetical protein [Otariodibacter sp.]
MNYDILFKSSPLNEYPKIFKAVQSDDLIGTVLRLHLLLERTLELRICAICNQENLFGNKSKNNDKNRFFISFDAKVKMALALGLDNKLFNLIQKINTIRNIFAHQNETIPSKHIEGSIEIIKNIQAEKNKTIDDYGVQLNPDDIDPIIMKFSDENLTKKDLFILITMYAIEQLHK